MTRSHWWILVTLLPMTFVSTAYASSTVVPDDVATIQAAIAAGTDSVLVKDGTYDEAVVVDRNVALVAFRSTSPTLYVHAPVVRSLETAPGKHLIVDSFHFLGPVKLGFNGTARFESCRFDSGLTSVDENSVWLVGCTVFKEFRLNSAVGYQLINNTFIGTGISASSHSTTVIRGNHIQGPAPFGMRVSGDIAAVIDHNTVVGTTEGISAAFSMSFYVTNNEVRDCTGFAFRSSEGSFNSSTVRRAHYLNNRALHCGGHGIDFDYEGGVAIGNVIGHCGGAGIRHTRARRSVFSLYSNTLFENGGPGIEIITPAGRTQATPDTIANNIVYGSGGYGLVWSGIGPATLKCNDWFANTTGPTSGIAPGASDLFVDPRFCDVASDNVYLGSSSPVLDAPGCGLIGALGKGCDDFPTPTLIDGFEGGWVDGVIELRWRMAAAGTFSSVRAERADAITGPWLGIGASREANGFTIVIDGSAATERVHFYRLIATHRNGGQSTFGPIEVEGSTGGLRFEVGRPGPNPSSGRVGIAYTLPAASAVRVSVMDLQGREIAVLENGTRQPGHHDVTWDGTLGSGRAASGVYFIHLDVAGKRLTRRIVLSR